MAEGSVEKTLAIKITPKLDIDALTQQIKQAVTAALGESKISFSTTNGENKGQSSTTSSGDESSGDKPKTGKTGDESKKIATIRAVGTIAKTGFNLAQQTFNGIFGIIKEIHARVKQSSAFLAAVENLFNLAVTLLLMPLGNAIAEVILPSTIDLVDNVLKLWSRFEQYAGQGDLKSIISLVMSEGLQLIGEYLKDIGKIFTDSGDTLLESVGSLFNWLGGLLESGKLAGILETLFKIFKVFADNMHIWIPLIIAYQAAQIAATIGAAAGPIWGAAAAATGAAVGFAAGSALFSNADGGEYAHVSGGQVIRVAEHEDEVVMPKSKLLSGGYGGGNTYYTTINGFTTEEVKQIVRDVLHEEVSNSQYRSGL